MGLFTRKSAPIRKAWKELGAQGQDTYDYGRGLTDEGLGGLRDLRRTFDERTDDPLGDVGRGIFARARGALSDDFTRNVNAGDARRRQLALQSGGSLTAEQIAALDSEDRRSAGEQLFRGQNELSMGEGEMTFSELNRLFDRMTDIDKTITGVGQDERTRGLQAIIQSILGRQSLHFGNIAAATQAVGMATSFGTSAGAGGGSAGQTPTTGVWGG